MSTSRLMEILGRNGLAGRKRVSPPKRNISPLTLGIRNNIRVTVTAREELFSIFDILGVSVYERFLRRVKPVFSFVFTFFNIKGDCFL